MNYVEIIGYIGSVLVAVSLMMKNIYYLTEVTQNCHSDPNSLGEESQCCDFI